MDSFEHGEPEVVRQPRKLLWEIKFRIDSPLAIEACIDRIFSIDTGSKWLMKRRKLVKVYQLEEDRIYFHIHVPRQGSPGWLIGELQPIDDASTSVHGSIGIDALPVYGTLTFMGLICLTFLLIPVGLILAPIVFGYWFYSIRRDGIETRDELKQILEEKLAS
jgi:hypothetical protein